MLKRSFSPFALEVFSVMTGFCALSCGRAMVTSARDKAQATKLCNLSSNFISFYICGGECFGGPSYLWKELNAYKNSGQWTFSDPLPTKILLFSMCSCGCLEFATQELAFCLVCFLSILFCLLLRMAFVAKVEDSDKCEERDKDESHLKGILHGVYPDLFEEVPSS